MTYPFRDDRLARMMADPEGYMAEARERARAIVERDMAAERERDRRRRERRRHWFPWFRRTP